MLEVGVMYTVSLLQIQLLHFSEMFFLVEGQPADDGKASKKPGDPRMNINMFIKPRSLKLSTRQQIAVIIWCSFLSG